MYSLLKMYLSREDYNLYSVYVKNSMKEDDYVEFEELKYKVQNEGFESWWLINDVEILGWCGLSEKSIYYEGAKHLYGGCIFPKNRKKGFGTKLWTLRMEKIKGTPITVSIQPDNEYSLKIAEKLNFKPLGKSGIWNNFIYMNN